MAHSQDTNYIIEVIADGWARPASFNGSPDPDPATGNYRIVDNQTGGLAASYGYITSHEFPAGILAICPNAPDSSYTEAKALTENIVWTGS